MERKLLLPFDTVLYFSSEVKTVTYGVLESVGIINGAHQSDICATQLSMNEQTAGPDISFPHKLIISCEI